mgnify:CR=1 FL=1
MNKTLILVVEDDRPIRNLIITTLKTHDYKYLAAENGSSAILEASSHNPDIVLLDLGLPDMEGVEVIKKIRTWSNMPIIVISARSEDTDKIEALDAGAEDFVAQEDVFEIYTSPAEFSKVREALESAGYTFLKAEVAMIPQNTVNITDPEVVEKVNKFLDNLDDNDDVQEVFHNAILPEEDEE